MMDYIKTKNYRMKINASMGKNRFIDIDWLIMVDIDLFDFMILLV